MNSLPHQLVGNKNSKQLLVFLHGWPDTLELWGKFLPDFEKNYLVLNISYPNYHAKEFNPWGASFEEIVDRLKITLDAVNAEKRKITFVAHDWGAIFSYLFDQTYPGVISDLIVFDVAPWVKANVLIVAYQLFLLSAFLVGGKLADFMVNRFAKLIKYKSSDSHKVKASMGYSYYYIWKEVVKAKFNIRRLPLYSYKPSCSVAYVWGKNKPVQFHNKKWLEVVKAGLNNFLKEVDAGHWIMHEQPDFVKRLIKERLDVAAKK